MRLAGLEGRCKKRWRKTTVADPAGRARPSTSSSRHFGPAAEIDRRYVGDITYIATWEGWAYLATVIDLASRRVVGWALADHMRTELVSDALEMAFATRCPAPGAHLPLRSGLSIHQHRLRRPSPAPTASCCQSARNGECWDNAVAESFFATIKRELIDTRAWPTRAGLRTRGVRLHRGLVQHPPPTQLARLPQPSRVRSAQRRQSRPQGGMINTTKLSVEADQAHTTSGWAMHIFPASQ